MAHELEPERDNTFLDLGRLLHEESYSREKKEFAAPGMKIDLIKKCNDELVVGEIKKSSRFTDSAKMQLAYYIWRLKESGVEAKGELLIPKERKRIPVELTEEIEEGLMNAMADIQQIIAREKPPSPVRIAFCRNCAYAEFCWG